MTRFCQIENCVVPTQGVAKLCLTHTERMSEISLRCLAIHIQNASPRENLRDMAEERPWVLPLLACIGFGAICFLAAARWGG